MEMKIIEIADPFVLVKAVAERDTPCVMGNPVHFKAIVNISPARSVRGQRVVPILYDIEHWGKAGYSQPTVAECRQISKCAREMMTDQEA
jgi:hypothetical protein